MNRLALAAVVIVLAGCGAAVSAEEVLRTRLQELGEEVVRLIGSACDRDEQCRLIALGHKPCGGPAAYRAYSTIDTDVALLETRAHEYNRLAEQYNRETGAVSDCAVVTPPMVTCAGGRCVTVTQSP